MIHPSEEFEGIINILNSLDEKFGSISANRTSRDADDEDELSFTEPIVS